MSSAWVQIANTATSRAEFEREVLGELERRIGFDVAFFASTGVPDAPTLVRFDENPLADMERGLVYVDELREVKAAALARRGVAVDADILGARARECTYFKDLVAPRGGGASLLAYLRLRGEVRGLVMLGRCGGPARFAPSDVTVAEHAVADIAVAHASYPIARGARLQGLSERQRDLVEYLCLGYTNREIALACGLSPNTVRNQLARVFEKLGASTRAEAVGIARS